MTERRRVYLHIGLPKTGSTYIQDALWQNKPALAERGLLVPGRYRRRHLLASLDLREDPRLARRAREIDHPWQALVDEIESYDGDALVSHEFFGAAAQHQIERARDSFPDADLHAIVMVRDMVSLGISRWQEWVKNGGGTPIDEYPRRRLYDPTNEWGWGSFDLAEVLDRWGSVLPHERIHVLPMAPSRRRPEELWHRVLDVVGVSPDGLESPPAPVNQSLGVVELELLRRVTRNLEGFGSAVDRGHWIRGRLAEGGLIAGTGERFRPGPEKLAELRSRGDRARAELESGGYDLVGDIGVLEPRDVEGLRHPSEVTDGELLDSAVESIARLVDELRQETARANRATRESAAVQAELDAVRADLARPLARRLLSGVRRRLPVPQRTRST